MLRFTWRVRYRVAKEEISAVTADGGRRVNDCLLTGAGRKGHVKRGCGKRNWRHGGSARWRCKPGKKKHAYKT